MVKKITRRYNKKLTNEFKSMKLFKTEFDVKLYYVSGVNSIPRISKEEATQLAITFDKNPNKWKKYTKVISVHSRAID